MPVSLGKRKAELTPEQQKRVQRNKKLALERKSSGAASSAANPARRKGRDPFYKTNEFPKPDPSAYPTFTHDDGEETGDQMYSGANGWQLGRNPNPDDVYFDVLGTIYILKDDGKTRSIYKDKMKVGEESVYKLKLELTDKKGQPISLDQLEANEDALQKAFYDRRDNLPDEYAVKNMYQTAAANAAKDGVDPSDFHAVKHAFSNAKWKKKEFDGKKKYVDNEGNIISKSELVDKGVKSGIMNFPTRIKSYTDQDAVEHGYLEIDLLQDQVTGIKDMSQKNEQGKRKIVHYDLQDTTALHVGDLIKMRVGMAAYCNGQGAGFTIKGPYGYDKNITVFKSDKSTPVNIHGDKSSGGGNNDDDYLAFLDEDE